MSRRGKILTAAFVGIAIASASPALAQWGGYGDMGHGFGYSGYGQGNCGFGQCGYATEFGKALEGTSKQNPETADYEPPPAAPQKKGRSSKGRVCYKLEWGAEGWVNVPTPCQ